MRLEQSSVTCLKNSRPGFWCPYEEFRRISGGGRGFAGSGECRRKGMWRWMVAGGSGRMLHKRQDYGGKRLLIQPAFSGHIALTTNRVSPFSGQGLMAEKGCPSPLDKP